ncbi:hypothetical protein LOX52_08850, partial [Latilactobacillus curvatus]|uniref:hypothetical protein n=1 Tax=Latilactobacillus curvatus TaxID=28038 RepID=UPI0020C7793F
MTAYFRLSGSCCNQEHVKAPLIHKIRGAFFVGVDRWEIFEKFCYNGGNKLGRKVSFMDDKDKLELEIARLKMEN